MRKFSLILCVTLMLLNYSSASWAQEAGGNVILDFQGNYDREYDDRKFWPTVIQKGMDYVNDVKQYNEQLDGDNIDRDFTEDLLVKYPDYSPTVIEGWQKYVRKGVKALRFFDQMKQKVKKWILDYELPIVVDDDQYEMGGKEEYIESSDPLIRENFKKVVAYSKSSKDRLAVEEKYAKDHNLTRPSQLIKWYRENISQGNWKKLWKSLWKDPLTDKGDKKDELQELQRMVTTLIMKNNGFDQDGKFEGIINITPPHNKIVLLSEYKQYAGLVFDFSNSENVEDIKVHFMLPKSSKDNDNRQILFYGGKFSVYFAGKVKDAEEDAVIRLNCEANVCADQSCEMNYGKPELVIKPSVAPQKTIHANYIDMIKANVASENNKNNFNIYGLFEEIREGHAKGVRLEFAADKNVRAKVFMIGEAAKHFAVPQISLKDGKISAWFRLNDEDFDYKNKDYTFWLSEGSTRQYITTLKLKTESFLNLSETKFSFGILGLALLGGFLLNFMPCVFPVLSLKLLAFTKFGGLNEAKIRSNFIYNSLGIGTAFIILALLLSGLKMAGIALGWGMQFQSISFLAVMIWIVTYFLAYIFGIVGQNSQSLPIKAIKKVSQQDKWFEFLSGLFMVALSTPCMAPYLGTAMGIALAGSPFNIVITIITVGLGLALPYILIAIFPKIAFYMPRPGKWLNWINAAMIIMLIITLGWLISLLAAQSYAGQIWHWLLYVVGALILWTFYDMLRKETNKVKDKNIKDCLHKTYNRWKIGLTVILLLVSFADVKFATYKKGKQNTVAPVPINLQIINDYVAQGRKVLVKIGADWCLTCKYNDNFVLGMDYVQDDLLNNNVLIMEVDWTNYNEQVLHFMQKFGRQGLPFYILFSPTFSEGVVLPELLDKDEISTLINM